MKKSKQRFLAGLSAAALALTLSPAAFAAGEDTLTRGEAWDALAAAADDYNPALLEAQSLLKGDENGQLHLDRPITRAEALVMLERAFGGLPTPVGANARSAFPAETFTDVPDWAQAELAGVFEAGIVAGTGEGLLSPEAPITAGELETLIRRVYALKGSNLKDDFYAAVNKEWLDAATLPAGRTVRGTMYDLMDKVDEDVAGLITEIADGKHKKGTGEQKIADLYHNVMDWGARNEAGLAPIQPYLDAVDAIETQDDLLAALKTINDELYVSLMLGFGLTVDLKDSTKYTVIFGAMAPSMTKDFYTNGTQAQTDAYMTYLTTLAKLGGADEADAQRQAENLYELEKTLAAAMLNPQEQNDVDKIYNLYTMDELQTLFPKVDLEQVYAMSGLKQEDTIGVTDVGLIEAAAGFFDGEHVEQLKDALRLYLLINYGGALNREFTDASFAFNQAYMGMEGAQTDEKLAAAQVQSLMSGYLEQAYVKKYFSAEAKADVEAMIADFISIYKERIQKLEWMSDETKAMAAKKLDTMLVNVGYPDEWDDSLDKVEIKGVADGGSFFDNLIAIAGANRAEHLAYQGKPVDKEEWFIPAFTVNAFYQATNNSITFPAGILQAPMYDVEASREENLGKIGYVIAHEITHAFDNNGAKFDENGNAANWWAEADYAAFQSLCDGVVAWYDGQESAPGITCNGALTISENVADLGAAACVTEAAGREENPDYETLYRSMAECWAFSANRAYQEAVMNMDVHAPDKLRGGRVLQTLDQFYETFDIQPGDGMWVEPEARVSIW